MLRRNMVGLPFAMAGLAAPLQHPGARAQQPRRGGTLVQLVISEPPHLVGAFGGPSTVSDASTKIFDTLLMEGDGTYTALLA